MIIDDIALTLEHKIDPKTVVHLLECFGSAQAIYEASTQQLIDNAELKPQLATQLSGKQNHKRAAKELEYIQKHNITAIESTSPLYPELLKECCDYPHVIYIQGDATILNSTMLTMVGTRNLTNYGARMCDEIIKSLASIVPDLVIVSGLAYGIDVGCHRAALRYGLRTIGVVPCCLPEIAPVHHRDVARDMILRGGCVMSELNSGSTPQKWLFPRRNRILAGLSCATVVVESFARSGSLNTANIADSYNRMVMAVPGRADDKSSEGPNALIRRLKARMVCSGSDIADELGWEEVSGVQTEAGFDLSLLSKDQRGLYSCFKDDTLHSVDSLLEITGVSINMLTTLLFELEMAGVIRSVQGNKYQKLS